MAPNKVRSCSNAFPATLIYFGRFKGQ